jgi:hypothetical protein
MKNKSLFILLFCSVVTNSYGAEQISFPKLWEMVANHSPSAKAIILEKEASNKSTERLSKYIFPTFYANSRLMATNDPGLTFMNFLNEGQVKQEDFVPSNLNSPSNHIFNQSDVGIDYLIYDSGSRASLLSAKEHESKAIEYEQSFNLLNQYVHTFQYFSGYVLTKNYVSEIKAREINLNSIISKYQVGHKSNPVGYNGLLSLKGIQNKIDLIQLELNSNLNEIKNSLKLITGNSEMNFEPDSTSFEDLIKLYATIPENSNGSFQVSVEKENSNSLKEQVTQQKSQYLPKIGVFGQENLAVGERGSQPSYVVGAYLKYNFSPTDFGSGDETELLALAMQKNAENIAINDSLSLEDAKNNLEKNKQKLILLNKSDEILSEQFNVLMNLYKNGNAPISQIAEIMNRRIDILNQKYLFKQEILKSTIELMAHSQKDVQPQNIWNLKI